MDPFEELPEESYKQILQDAVVSHQHTYYWDQGKRVRLHILRDRYNIKRVITFTPLSDTIKCSITSISGVIRNTSIYNVKYKDFKLFVTEHVNNESV